MEGFALVRVGFIVALPYPRTVNTSSWKLDIESLLCNASISRRRDIAPSADEALKDTLSPDGKEIRIFPFNGVVDCVGPVPAESSTICDGNRSWSGYD